MRISRAVTAIGVSSLASVFLIISPTPSGASPGKSVRIFDDCDVSSFNAAVPAPPNGPPTCVGDGETTFPDFIAEVQRTRQAEEWRFKPDMLKVKSGRPVIVENRGGETHTFTLVKTFGGGFIAPLNALTGNTTLAPECAKENADGSLSPTGPGQRSLCVSAGSKTAFQTAGLLPGTYQFQCCIHPWMRIILTVK